MRGEESLSSTPVTNLGYKCGGENMRGEESLSSAPVTNLGYKCGGENMRGEERRDSDRMEDGSKER